MKSYDELTNDLLERRDRYVADQKKKRKRVMGVATSLCCFCSRSSWLSGPSSKVTSPWARARTPWEM